MSQITTHVLDTSKGQPAIGIEIIFQASATGSWEEMGRGITDGDGRISDLLPANQVIAPGKYRLVFKTGVYFSSQNTKTFYPQVTIEFETTDSSHYHVPLLLNPFGYSTYRGS